MKKLARRIASFFVTLYYNRNYKKAKELCDKRHHDFGEMFYVIDWPTTSGKNVLRVINRKKFRSLKHWAQKYYVSKDLRFWSNEYNIALIKDGSWYHTANREEKDGLSAQQAEIRRLAFIREGLKRAKLL
jgi:hypothetical protein